MSGHAQEASRGACALATGRIATHSADTPWPTVNSKPWLARQKPLQQMTGP